MYKHYINTLIKNLYCRFKDICQIKNAKNVLIQFDSNFNIKSFQKNNLYKINKTNSIFSKKNMNRLN